MPQFYLSSGQVVTAPYVIPCFYRVPLTTIIGANGNQTQTLITDGSSTFKLFYFEAWTDQDDSAITVSNAVPAIVGGYPAREPNYFKVRITLSDSTIISNDYIPQSILAPKQSRILEPLQIEFPGNSKIKFEVTSLYAGGNLNVDIWLRGVKIMTA